MGTRCGQLDPGVLLYLMDQKGMTAREISDLLYRKSGLLGLSGLSNDMRTLEADGTPEAAQAIDYFVFRCQREVGAMAAALRGIDALIFCGGIGENSRLIRARICERLGWMGIEIDHARNAGNAQIISSELARTTVLVVPTNEELVIARANAIMNQCYFFDVNNAGQLGNGRSIVVGPDGEVLHQAGPVQEVFPLTLDLGRVRTARRQGLKGLGQVMKSFRDGPHAQPNDFLAGLGPLRLPTRAERAQLDDRS